jgi:ATP-dependent helicase YprA (DUF1998 family)
MTEPLVNMLSSLSSTSESRLDEDILDALSDNELRKVFITQTQAHTRLIPHDFQLDAAVALWRNQDLMVIASTGSGKTLSFVMPCFLSKCVVVVIVSPLNALQDDQVSIRVN